MINASAYITKNGLLAIFATSGTEFVNITAISGSPSIYFENPYNEAGYLPVPSFTGPFWANQSQNCPWVMYKLFFPHNIQSYETFMVSIPSGFIKTPAGPVVAQTGIMATNYLGYLEPSVGTYGGETVPGFNSLDCTMPLGNNTSWATQPVYFSSYFAFANSLKRASLSADVLEYDSNNHPVLLSSKISLNPIQTNSEGAIDTRGIPTMTGVYTIIANENNPQHPMTITATVPGTSVSISGGIPVGSGLGKTWSWHLNYIDPNSIDCNFRDLQIIITIAGTGINGGGEYSLSGEQLLTPNNSEILNDWSPDTNFTNWLTTKSGKTPKYLRWTDCVNSYGGESNAVNAGDMINPDLWLWGDDYTKQFNVIALRNFNSTDSPCHYWSQNWTNSISGNGLYALPASPGMLNFSGPRTQWYVGEFIYDNSYVQLKSGQTISISTKSLIPTEFTNGNNSGISVGFGNWNGPIFVTSPSGFVFTGYYGGFSNTTGQPGNINNIIGTTYVSGVTGSIQVPFDSTAGYGPTAFVTNSFSGTSYWANFSAIGADDMVLASISGILDNLSPGTSVLCEYGNEMWNESFTQYFTSFVLGYSAAFNSGNTSQQAAVVYRTAEMHNICSNYSDSLGNNNQIIRSFGSQCSVPALTSQIVSIINTWNIENPFNTIKMDSAHVAPYISPPNDSSLVSACASIYSTFSGSVAYGSEYPFSRSQWMDVFRHYVKYNTSANGPNGYLTAHKKALAGYIPVQDQPSGFIPDLILYECGLQSPIPVGVSSPNNTEINYGLCHDLFYDYSMADLETACYQSWQFGGASCAVIYALCMPRIPETTSMYCWGQYIWNGQQPGNGYENLFYFDTGLGQDFNNQSTRGYAWQNWADIAN
jgi:hypothetical protein